MSRLLSLALLLGGCDTQPQAERIEPSFIRVTVSGDVGTEEAPLPFSPELTTWPMEVSTFDVNADPYPFNGDLKLRVRPGRLEMDPWIHITDGHWSGDVTFEAGFGPTRVWFSDEGDKDTTTGRTPGYATGVTDPIHYAFPTIAEMQDIEDTETNQLAGEYTELDIASRNVVVNWIGTSGFWATDLDSVGADDTPGGFASVFVYTFNKPDGIERGTRLAELKGSNQEYLATTQLSFPTYSAMEGETLDIPDPIALDDQMPCDDRAMESLESSLVQAEGLIIPSSFGEGDADYTDYLDYGQWPAAQDGGCTIYVDSSGLEGFDPVQYAGQTLPTVRGTVSQVWGKWIIVANSLSDIGDQVDAAESRVRRPRPRHRIPQSPVLKDRLNRLPSLPRSTCAHSH